MLTNKCDLNLHLHFGIRLAQFPVQHVEMRCQANTNSHNKNIDEIPYKCGIFAYVAECNRYVVWKGIFVWIEVNILLDGYTNEYTVFN